MSWAQWFGETSSLVTGGLCPMCFNPVRQASCQDMDQAGEEFILWENNY